MTKVTPPPYQHQSILTYLATYWQRLTTMHPYLGNRITPSYVAFAADGERLIGTSLFLPIFMLTATDPPSLCDRRRSKEPTSEQPNKYHL